MGTDAEFYIAWDGKRYRGSPPSGWYLAVDNRWWPPQEQIQSTTTAPASTDGRSDGALDGAERAPATEPADRAASTVEPSWAPQPGELEPPWSPPRPGTFPGAGNGPSGSAAGGGAAGGPLPPPPGGAPSAGGTRSRPRRRFRPGFLIPVLIFALFRCTAGFDGGSDASEITFPTTSEFATTIVPTTAASDGATESPDLSVPTTAPPATETTALSLGGGLELTVQECGPDNITATARSLEAEEAVFLVDLEIEPSGSGSTGPGQAPSRVIGPLAPGEATPIVLALPSTLDRGQTCSVTGYSATSCAAAAMSEGTCSPISSTTEAAE